MINTKHAVQQAPESRNISTHGQITWQLLLLVSKHGAGQFPSYSPGNHEVIQASLDLHTNFRPNLTEGLKEPTGKVTNQQNQDSR